MSAIRQPCRVLKTPVDTHTCLAIGEAAHAPGPGELQTPGVDLTDELRLTRWGATG